MKTIIKLGLAGIAAGAAYYLSRQDVQVGEDGIQRFSTEAHQKAMSVLAHSEGADTPESHLGGGRFAMGVNPHPDGSGTQILGFINLAQADGFKMFVSKNILDPVAVEHLQAVLVGTTVSDAFDLGAKGSEFVML